MVKNYTSQVSAKKSVQNIEDRLVKNGAKNILKLYDNNRLVGIAFTILVDGEDTPFKLPARIDRVEKHLISKIRKPQAGTLERIRNQAERTAWKILADWVDIQMSLIELDQVEFLEVFMSFVYDHSKEQTFFEKMKTNGFKMLENKIPAVNK